MIESLWSKFRLRQLMGFSGVGVAVSIAGLVLTYIMIELWKWPLLTSYVLIYAGTILLSYFLNSSLVFRSSFNLLFLFQYFMAYLSGMLVGLLVLWIFEKTLPLQPWILAYLVVPVTTLWNYFFATRIFKKPHA
jgi:putative flippase GtrA